MWHVVSMDGVDIIFAMIRREFCVDVMVISSGDEDFGATVMLFSVCCS